MDTHIKIDLDNKTFSKIDIAAGSSVTHSSNDRFPILSTVALMGIINLLTEIPKTKRSATIEGLKGLDDKQILNAFGFVEAQ